MSGICGIIRLDGCDAASADLERQTRRMAHLGPDRIGASVEGPAALAHLMMRITREDRRDAQPLHQGDLSLVADVRLDNREELAALLALDIEDMPDSELVLAAWRRWGESCTEHLIGDFAFAVWDARARTLTLVRDHMGQRHVFYTQSAGFFAFAAEIKGLWALPDVPRELNEQSVMRALLMEEKEPGTTDYDNIRAVPGGSILKLAADGAITMRRYWLPHAGPEHLGKDETYYIATYRKVLAEAVQCRLRRATYAGGLFNGGGFDSSAVCALSGAAVVPNGLKFVSACSVMPEDYRGTIRHARKWVEMCRRVMPHLEVRYVTRDGLDIFSFMEEGFLSFDGRHSPNRYVTHALFQEIRNAGGRIAMDGHGGDYTVNPRGQNALLRLLAKGQLRRFVSEFRATGRHMRLGPWKNFKTNIARTAIPHWVTRLRTRRRHGLALFGPTLPLSQAVKATRNAKAGRGAGYRPSAPQSESMVRTLCSQQNFPAQGYSIAGAQHGLEFTQPFHDKRVVEFGLAIPEDLYVKDGKTRWLARRALKDLYPPEYQDRLPGNDDMGPDFLIQAKRVEPRVLAEIDRMEQAGYLNRYFDFPRMRAMLTRRTVDDHNSGSEFDTRQAQLAFIAARYIEWFRGNNR